MRRGMLRRIVAPSSWTCRPRRAVERCNDAWRYEFYATVDLPTMIDKIAEHVDAFQHLYNHHRPHGALEGLTPNEYLKICRDRITHQSHMY